MAYISFQPSDHFSTKLYTGNGSTQNITGVGHQVDWTWIKYRTDTEGHGLFDRLRGALYRLQSNSNIASSSQAGTVTAFGSDGFSLGNNAEVNANNGSYVSWNWKLNGQGSSNTDGSINTTYTSANTTSGVSISMYEGTGSNASFGHGLSTAPEFVMVKGLDATSQWFLYSKSVGANKVATLDNASAFTTDTVSWQNTDPTSSVVTIGNDGGTNSSGNTMLAYCFSPIKGFSAMGSYSGTGDVNGAFIYTGFKPAFLWVARTDSSDGHFLYDNKRSPFNVRGKYLVADGNGTDSNADAFDFLSNGFKVRSTATSFNNSSGSYLYMAFADQPLVSSNGVPATAE